MAAFYVLANKLIPEAAYKESLMERQAYNGRWIASSGRSFLKTQ